MKNMKNRTGKPVEEWSVRDLFSEHYMRAMLGPSPTPETTRRYYDELTNKNEVSLTIGEKRWLRQYRRNVLKVPVDKASQTQEELLAAS